MNTTAGCPHQNWVLCVNTFRLVILTWNRPHSLARLLDSVTATHWNWPASPDWDIVIDFQVDGGGGERGEEVRRLVENFTFPVGRKVVRAHTENRGPVAAWRDAWTWRDREMFIIVEDDAELSKHWSVKIVSELLHI